jgi:hypothetical protein
MCQGRAIATCPGLRGFESFRGGIASYNFMVVPILSYVKENETVLQPVLAKIRYVQECVAKGVEPNPT